MGQWVKSSTADDHCDTLMLGDGVFLNQEGSPEVGQEIVRLISGASKSIEIVNPIITDHVIVKALSEARSRGVRVKIITELRENRSEGIRYPTRGFEATDSHVLKDHFDAIRVLASNRVLCRGMSRYMHAKLLLVDRRVMLMSSVNLTANSLGWGNQPSLEAGLRVEEPAEVEALARTVTAIWNSCPFRLHLLGTDVSLQQEGTRSVDLRQLRGEVSPACRMDWSFPPTHFGVRDLLVELCDAAHERLVFSAMSFFDIDKVPALHSAICRALRRGVHVIAIVRPEHFKPDQYPDASTMTLIDQGLQLVGQSGLHAKGVVADKTSALIMSANLNPFSLDSQVDSANIECGLLCRKMSSGPMLDYGSLIEWISEHPTHRYALK